MKKVIIVLSVMVLTISGYTVSSIPAFAQGTIVVPNNLTNIEGDSNNRFPFSCSDTFLQILSMRYQQVYAASQLRSGVISEISFRLNDLDPGAFSGVVPNVQIDMSITDAVPAGLSPTFANNLGPVVQTVFSGDLALSAPDCTTIPCPFDVHIPLQNPFTYINKQGNLIIDVRVPECVNLRPGDPFLGGAFFDATTTELGDTSRATTSVNGSVNSPEAQFFNDFGLVTQFSIAFIQPIPTLSEWGLIAMAGVLGLVGFIAIRKKYSTV